jgi:hypothetical protein
MRRLFGFRLLAGIGLLVAAGVSVLSQGTSARDPVARFCKLDAQGEQLSPEGWLKLAALFVNPGARRIGEIMVVKDFGVSHPFPEKDKIGFVLMLSKSRSRTRRAATQHRCRLGDSRLLR